MAYHNIGLKVSVLILVIGILCISLAIIISSDVMIEPAPEEKSGVERLSSFDHINEEQIKVSPDNVQIDVIDATWTRFEDSNSMDPMIDIGANGIQVMPTAQDDLHEGDVVLYTSQYTDKILIHRIVSIDNDEQGWYALMKGDNNMELDPGKARYGDIKGILVSVIY